MTVAPNRTIQAIATRRLFADLIEPLNDSFDPSRADLADRVVAQLISRYRHSSSGREFDRRLSSFGLKTEEEMLSRRDRTARQALPADADRLRHIFVLSRVTIGADVAVSSVITAHLKRAFPDARIVLVGPAKLKELFGNDSRLSFLEVEYQRSGVLTDRLEIWTSLVDSIGAESKGLGADEFLVVDPDSRMTQLGLLPVTAEESSYALCDSRRLCSGEDRALAEIADGWAAERWPVSGQKRTSYPFVAPLETLRDYSRIKLQMSRSGERLVVFVSLGVGGNQRKRVSPEFERRLVAASRRAPR
jgi:hypothetical protein